MASRLRGNDGLGPGGRLSPDLNVERSGVLSRLYPQYLTPTHAETRQRQARLLIARPHR